MSHAEVAQGLVDRGQDGVHGGVDGATETVGQNSLGEGRKNADGGLGPDLEQDWLDGTGPCVVDDLGRLHPLSRRDVEAGHIAPDIGIADYRDQPRHPRVLWNGSANSETQHTNVRGPRRKVWVRTP